MRTRNWAGTTFDSNSITEVQEVAFSEQNAVLNGSGDNALYDTATDVVGIRRMCRISTEDLADMNAFDTGDEGTLVSIHKAQGNNAGTAEAGDLTFTLSNAVCTSKGQSGRHRQWGQATAEFQAYSSDGATDPLAVTVTAP